jgi:transposase-like protein
VKSREGNLPARKARAVAALVSARSVGEAARRAGVGRRTVFRWKRSDLEFRTALEEARREIVRAAVAEGILKLGGALDTLSKISGDEAAPAAVRGRAASAMLRFLMGEGVARADDGWGV